MKRKYILVFAFLMFAFLFSCKCSKRLNVTEETIKNDYKYFDVTININNERYNFIKSSILLICIADTADSPNTLTRAASITTTRVVDKT